MKAYPTLAEYLTSSRWADGSARDRSSLMLLCGDVEGFKAVLNDRANGRGLWVTGRSIEVLLQTLEALLNDASCPWRPDRQQKGSTRR